MTDVLHDDLRTINMESVLEDDVAAVLRARRDIVCLRDQWPTVTYIRDDGTQASHTFDFHVTLQTGRTCAIGVRPKARAEKVARAIEIMKVEKKQLRQFADNALLITELAVDGGPAKNARQILRARDMRNAHQINLAWDAVRNIWGAFRFRDALTSLDIPAHRRNALWCLIDDGLLAPVTPGEITDSTYLRVLHQLDTSTHEGKTR